MKKYIVELMKPSAMVTGISFAFKMRVEHPVLYWYWMMITLGLLVLRFPLVMFFAWQEKSGYHSYFKRYVDPRRG